ncbi:hypothetical protein NKR23_g6971 [Pleurostoma richardsiae]|uniref:Ribosomal RNA-processing protein 17 n=1 Tax=Pleurostoma richardsiae TaxID=41990 RepID=A0AA38RX92_9PEZI|nr:hypothetical protein NKR23_g6971 [Pleurostoma richardsiae]
MFAHPRPKKSVLPPPSKKRKTAHSIEEITFDRSARTEYLTGFHKRKQQRIKHAQEIAAEKERKEKIEFRKQVREERKQQLEDHVRKVKAILKETGIPGLGSDSESEDGEDGDEWGGFQDEPAALEPVDHEEEYIDEDRYTTVTVEAVTVDRDGMHKPKRITEEEEDEDEAKDKTAAKFEGKDSEGSTDKKKFPPKKKKKKFRYESKAERQSAERRNKAKRRR